MHVSVYVCVCVRVRMRSLEGGWYIKVPGFHLGSGNLTKDPWEKDTLGMISPSPTQLRFSVLL